ncbi:MAG: phosphoribosyl-ATP diphosphatase [Oscillospiraceae bacterium]
MIDILREEYNSVLIRQKERVAGSYTCYLLEQGTDKILKKCGEECSEVIIAAKNGKKEELIPELSDLLYHLAVLMVNEEVSLENLEAEFEKRHAKEGNLKNFHLVDKNT